MLSQKTFSFSPSPKVLPRKSSDNSEIDDKNSNCLYLFIYAHCWFGKTHERKLLQRVEMGKCWGTMAGSMDLEFLPLHSFALEMIKSTSKKISARLGAIKGREPLMTNEFERSFCFCRSWLRRQICAMRVMLCRSNSRIESSLAFSFRFQHTTPHCRFPFWRVLVTRFVFA